MTKYAIKGKINCLNGEVFVLKVPYFALRRERLLFEDASAKMNNKTILVIGSSNIDILLNVPSTPSNGRTVYSYEKYAETPGGRGVYTAIATSRAGISTAFCTRIGADINGEKLKRAFFDGKLNTGYVKVDRLEQTGLDVLLLEKEAQAGRISFPGANAKLNSSDVESAFNSYPDLVITNLEASEETMIYTARFANSNETPLLIDTVGAYRNYPLSKLEKAEIIVSGENETELLTGVRPNTIENCLRASISLSNTLAVKYVILKLGERGVYLYDGKFCDMIMAKDLPIVDETAEHEASLGALGVEYLRSKNIFGAIEFALVASAVTASKVGAISSIPDEAEIRAVARKLEEE